MEHLLSLDTSPISLLRWWQHVENIHCAHLYRSSLDLNGSKTTLQNDTLKQSRFAQPVKIKLFDTHRPTMQPCSSAALLYLCLAAGASGGPKNTAEEYTAIPDLPVLRTSYPGLSVIEDGGDEEIWTLWIPSKASICLSGRAEAHQKGAEVSTEVTTTLSNACVVCGDPDTCGCQADTINKLLAATLKSREDFTSFTQPTSQSKSCRRHGRHDLYSVWITYTRARGSHA